MNELETLSDLRFSLFSFIIVASLPPSDKFVTVFILHLAGLLVTYKINCYFLLSWNSSVIKMDCPLTRAVNERLLILGDLWQILHSSDPKPPKRNNSGDPLHAKHSF